MSAGCKRPAFKRKELELRARGVSDLQGWSGCDMPTHETSGICGLHLSKTMELCFGACMVVSDVCL
jgi:hypothetical protein